MEDKEIKKIKDSALEIARKIITEYHDEVVEFTEQHLVKKEIMVRSEILGIFNELNVEPGKYYNRMCDALKKLDYPLHSSIRSNDSLPFKTRNSTKNRISACPQQ